MLSNKAAQFSKSTFLRSRALVQRSLSTSTQKPRVLNGIVSSGQQAAASSVFWSVPVMPSTSTPRRWLASSSTDAAASSAGPAAAAEAKVNPLLEKYEKHARKILDSVGLKSFDVHEIIYKLKTMGTNLEWLAQLGAKGVSVSSVESLETAWESQQKKKIAELGLSGENADALEEELHQLGITLDFLIEQKKQGVKFAKIRDLAGVAKEYRNNVLQTVGLNPQDENKILTELERFGVDFKWMLECHKNGYEWTDVESVGKNVIRYAGVAADVHRDDVFALVDKYGLYPDWLLQAKKNGVKLTSLGDIEKAASEECEFLEILSDAQLSSALYAHLNRTDVPIQQQPTHVIAIKKKMKSQSLTLHWFRMKQMLGYKFRSAADVEVAISHDKVTALGFEVSQYQPLTQRLSDLGIDLDFLIKKQNEGHYVSSFEAIDKLVSSERTKEVEKKNKIWQLGLQKVDRNKLMKLLDKHKISLDWLLDRQKENVFFSSLNDVELAVESHKEKMIKILGLEKENSVALNEMLAALTVSLEWLVKRHSEGYVFGSLAAVKLEFERYITDQMKTLGIRPDEPKSVFARLNGYGIDFEWLQRRKNDGFQFSSMEQIPLLLAQWKEMTDDRTLSYLGLSRDKDRLPKKLLELKIDLEYLKNAKAKGYELTIDNLDLLLSELGPQMPWSDADKLAYLGLPHTLEEVQRIKESLMENELDLDLLVQMKREGYFQDLSKPLPPPEDRAPPQLPGLMERSPPISEIRKAGNSYHVLHTAFPNVPAGNLTAPNDILGVPTKMGNQYDPDIAKVRPPVSKRCYLGGKKAPNFDILDVELMSAFMTEFGKMQRRTTNHTCAKKQRDLSKKIKFARQLGLIPSTRKHPEFLRVTKNYFMGERINKATPEQNWWMRNGDNWERFFK